MKKHSLIKGTLILGFAGIMAKFLGLFFRWPLIMLIGDEGVGYYQMSYPLYAFFIAAASGIPVAVSKMVSEKNAFGDREGVILVLRKALLMMLFIGIGFSAFLLIFSKQLVSFFKWDEKSYFSLVGIAIAPIFISIMSAFRGFFQGLQNMSPTAVSQVIEQIGRVVIGVGLAYMLLPRGIEYSAGGAAFGAAAGGILGGIYLMIKYIHIRKEFIGLHIKKDNTILTRLLTIAIPISVGATVGTMMSLIDSFIVPQKLLQAGYDFKSATILYGQLTGKAFVLVNVPLTLSVALGASLVPIIAEAHILNRRNEVVRKVELAIRIAIAIALPCFLGLCFLAQPVLNLIFPGHADGYKILKYLSLSIPFIVLAQSGTAILQGTGHYLRPVINLAIGCIFKIIITFMLVPIPYINIFGAVAGTLVGYIITAILNINYLQKTLKIKINYYDVIVKPAYASVIMIISVVITYSYVYNYTVSNGIATLVAISAGAVIYGILIALFGVFDYRYIRKRVLKK